MWLLCSTLYKLLKNLPKHIIYSVHSLNKLNKTKMALNMKDKRALFTAIIPEVNFSVGSSGITVSSPRLSTPRMIPFDIPNKCRHCKGTEVEMDYMVTKEGVTVWCTRLNEPCTVPFDFVCEMPGHTFFKIKNRGRVFNVEHGAQEEKRACATELSGSPMPKPRKTVHKKEEQQATTPTSKLLTITHPSPSQSGLSATPQTPNKEFVDLLTAATTFLPSESSTISAPPIPPTPMEVDPALKRAEEEELQNLLDEFLTASTFLTSESQQTPPSPAPVLTPELGPTKIDEKKMVNVIEPSNTATAILPTQQLEQLQPESLQASALSQPPILTPEAEPSKMNAERMQDIIDTISASTFFLPNASPEKVKAGVSQSGFVDTLTAAATFLSSQQPPKPEVTMSMASSAGTKEATGSAVTTVHKDEEEEAVKSIMKN